MFIHLYILDEILVEFLVNFIDTKMCFVYCNNENKIVYY